MLLPTSRNSPRLRQANPVHFFFGELLERKLPSPYLRKHLLTYCQPYLKASEDVDAAAQVLYRAALECYVEQAILWHEMHSATAGSVKYRTLGSQIRAWIETYAKAYWLKGLKTNKRGTSGKGKRLDLSA